MKAMPPRHGVKVGARRAAFLFLAPALAACLIGCAATSSPSPSLSPTQALLGALASAGLAVTKGGSFGTDPLGGTGTVVCAGSEPLQVYEFVSVAARETAATQINRQDPSRIGNAVVDWIGQPHFWQRDRVIVLSVGGSAALVATVTTVLGRPFAEGQPIGVQPNHSGCPST